MTDSNDIAKKTDAEIAELLKNEDLQAWEYVFANAVLPVVRRSHIRWIMRDRNISNTDVFGLLYEEMIARGKINLYRGGSLLGWMKCYVWGVIHRYCRKNPWAVSDEDFLDSQSHMTAPESKAETVEVIDRCFRELWMDNPLRAYVHLLKLKYNLSAEEIRELLALSSAANVNQLFSRAIKDMKRLKRKYTDE